MGHPVARLDRAAAPAARADRVALRSPRVLDDGTAVYDAVLVSVGDELRYPWGVEVATEQALADEAYLEGLRGLSVTLEHPEGLISQGQTPPGRGRRVGAVVGARFDPTDRAVVVELAVHDPADQAEVRERVRAVSEGYTPTLGEPDERGRVPQVGRVPNHIALVPAGRAPSADVRTDNTNAPEGTMEEMLAKLAELVEKMDGYAAKMDAACEKLDAMQAPAAEGNAEEQADRADADAQVLARLQRLDALRRTAGEFGVELPAGVDERAHRAAILGAIGYDAKRADSLDYYDAAVEGAKRARTDGAATATRNDSPRFAV